MRFAPAAAALSLSFAVTASISHADDRPDPRAMTLIAEGQAALSAGDTQAAIDAYESALAVDPGYTGIFLELAEAARSEGLQGKAIRYYREALARDPGNLAAISGEGEALFERIWPVTESANEAMFKGIPDADKDVTMRTLVKVLENIRVHPI